MSRSVSFRIAALLGLVVLAATGPAAAGRQDPGCSIAPGQASLGTQWTVSAWGLPKSTVNMIITFPDGAKSTGPIRVLPDGTFTTTGSSEMSADWGIIRAGQTGTFTYQFVGKVRWPGGTFNQLYAACSVQVAG